MSSSLLLRCYFFRILTRSRCIDSCRDRLASYLFKKLHDRFLQIFLFLDVHDHGFSIFVQTSAIQSRQSKHTNSSARWKNVLTTRERKHSLDGRFFSHAFLFFSEVFFFFWHLDGVEGSCINKIFMDVWTFQHFFIGSNFKFQTWKFVNTYLEM